MNASPPAEWIQEVINRFSRPLTQYAAHLTGDVDRARDAVQETLIALCDHCSQQNRGGDVIPGPVEEWKGWLFAVCRHKALTIARKERRMTQLSEDYDCLDDRTPVASEAGEPGDLLAHLATLPANQREVIRLKFLHGLSYREIAATTELTEGNVGFLIHTGLKTLRRKIAPERSC